MYLSHLDSHGFLKFFSSPSPSFESSKVLDTNLKFTCLSSSSSHSCCIKYMVTTADWKPRNHTLLAWRYESFGGTKLWELIRGRLDLSYILKEHSRRCPSFSGFGIWGFRDRWFKIAKTCWLRSIVPWWWGTFWQQIDSAAWKMGWYAKNFSFHSRTWFLIDWEHLSDTYLWRHPKPHPRGPKTYFSCFVDVRDFFACTCSGDFSSVYTLLTGIRLSCTRFATRKHSAISGARDKLKVNICLPVCPMLANSERFFLPTRGRTS